MTYVNKHYQQRMFRLLRKELKRQAGISSTLGMLTEMSDKSRARESGDSLGEKFGKLLRRHIDTTESHEN